MDTEPMLSRTFDTGSVEDEGDQADLHSFKAMEIRAMHVTRILGEPQW